MGQKPASGTGLQLSICPVLSKWGGGGEAAEMHGCDTAGMREEEGEEGGGGAMDGGSACRTEIENSREITSLSHSKACLACILSGRLRGALQTMHD